MRLPTVLSWMIKAIQGSFYAMRLQSMRTVPEPSIIMSGRKESLCGNLCLLHRRERYIDCFLEKQSEGAGALTDRDLSDIRRQLNAYSLAYSDESFDSVYGAKSTLEAMVMEYVNFNILESQGQMADQDGIHFKQVVTPVSGVVSYGIDSYETLDLSQINEGIFDRSGYEKAITKAGQRVEPGTPVYKVITDDAWSIIFPITEEEAYVFGTQGRVKVSFPGRNLNTTAAFSLVTGGDGKAYGRLDFDKYMVQFASERYVDFRIETSTTEGLKIPISSVTTKNFYLVPIDFLTKGETAQETDLIRKSILRPVRQLCLFRQPSTMGMTTIIILTVTKIR